MLLWAILKLMEIFGCLAPRNVWDDDEISGPAIHVKHPHRMVNMWFHPPINHGFWGVFRFWRNGQARPRHWNHMKPPKIQEHHLSGAIQLLQVLSSHPLGSGNGGFNPKICDHFYRENDDEPWKHLLFSYHFQVPNPPHPLRPFPVCTFRAVRGTESTDSSCGVTRKTSEKHPRCFSSGPELPAVGSRRSFHC